MRTNGDEIRRTLRTQLAVAPSIAGQALAVGRHRMKEGIKDGTIPVTPAGTIPTAWLRQVLLIDDAAA